MLKVGDQNSSGARIVSSPSKTVYVGGEHAAVAGSVLEDSTTVRGGSSDVIIEGRPALRKCDRSSSGTFPGNTSSVFVNGLR